MVVGFVAHSTRLPYRFLKIGAPPSRSVVQLLFRRDGLALPALAIIKTACPSVSSPKSKGIPCIGPDQRPSGNQSCESDSSTRQVRRANMAARLTLPGLRSVLQREATSPSPWPSSVQPNISSSVLKLRCGLRRTLIGLSSAHAELSDGPTASSVVQPFVTKQPGS